jgi:hypothetical protein
MGRPPRGAPRQHSSKEAAVKGGPEDRALSREQEVRARQERLLDEGIEETFPASDPVAIVRLT